VILVRSLLYFLAMVGTILFFGLAMCTVGLLFPLTTRDRWGGAWGHTNLWLMKRIIGLDYRVEGVENLPRDAAIVMSKHQSTWETIALKAILKPEQSWVLKRELMWIPVFGWALASVPTIPIDRKAGRKAAKQIVERGTELLRQGRLVVIFPEGTRTRPGERHRYGIGGGLLAEKSGYPVVPIAHNAGVYWPRRSLLKYPGTIQVVVGEAIESRGKKASEITREVEAWIESKMEELPLSRTLSGKS